MENLGIVDRSKSPIARDGHPDRISSHLETERDENKEMRRRKKRLSHSIRYIVFLRKLTPCSR